ncbi:MAG: competence/damage-inducible protein A [Bacteroidota bacterium]
MQAEIITIGDEILIGQITDTNSKWIAERLNEIGVSVYQITSIQDEKQHILKALAEAEENADIIILTGGLGPTKDDITKHTLVNYFGDELVMNENILKHIKNIFDRMNFPFTESDVQQAMLPKKATVLENEIGTAAGMWFNKNGKIFISLPGVPAEMKGLMQNKVLPKLQNSYHLPYIVHKTVQTYGMNESNVAKRIESWEKDLPDFITLAFLPSYAKLRLRLSAKGEDKEFLEESIDKEIEKLQIIIGDIIVGLQENEIIEVILNKKMSAKNLTLSTAESCTGGNIAKLITSIPGASNFFKGSIVAYSAKIKENILGIPSKTIQKYSVVSEQVAKEMALNCKKIFQSDYAIATTGNAGPTTDLTDKTVGVVFIAIATPDDVIVKEFNFGQPREKVILRSSSKALEMLKKEIDKNNKNSL